MGRATETRWRLVADFELLTKEWQGEIVLYHEGSGNTHLLDGAAARLFTLLGESPASVVELSEAWGREAPPCADLQALLGRLRRLDLVEPVSQ